MAGITEHAVYKPARQGLFTVVCILSFTVTASQTAYLGCFVRSWQGLDFRVNPGVYDIQTVTDDTCGFECGRMGYNYAGLTSGAVCLCGNNVPGDVQTVSDNNCSLVCPGVGTSTCGSHTYVSVYTTPDTLTALDIIGPGVLTSFEPVEIELAVTGGESITYTGEIYGAYWDTRTEFGPLSNPTLQYLPQAPGDLVVRATARGVRGESVTTSRTFKVQSKLREGSITLNCPPAVISGHTLTCSLTVGQGSQVTIFTDMRDGTTFTFHPPDILLSKVGRTNGQLAPPSSYLGDGYLYFLTNHEVKQRSSVVALEYNAVTPGEIIIQVYRPECSKTGEIFCSKTYSCIPSNQSCSTQRLGNHWKQTCQPDSKFSLSSRACVVDCGNVNPNVPITNWTDMEMDLFRLVYDLSVTLNSAGVGVHTFADTELLDVEPGDVIAVKEVTARLNILVSENSKCQFYKVVDNSLPWTSRMSDGFFFGGSVVPHPYEHALMFFLAESRIVEFQHAYNIADWQFFDIAVTAWNNVTYLPSINMTQIEVQTEISGVQIMGPNAGPTDSMVNFTVLPHRGSKPSYSWDWGDGQEGDTTAVRNMTHCYSRHGDYNVSVKAKNSISAVALWFVVYIQDRVENLTVSPTRMATVLGDPTTIQWNITRGSNITYELEMGDGQTYLLQYPFNSTESQANWTIQGGGLWGSLTHLYSKTSMFPFQISASNLVSKETVEMLLPVQIPVKDFRILNTKPITFGESRRMTMKVKSGSHIDVFGTLNDSIIESLKFLVNRKTGYAWIRPSNYLTNGLYNFSVSVTNLVSPILQDNVELWVDYPITDLEIDIDRPFVPVDETVTFNITMERCSRVHIFVNFGSDNDTGQYYFYRDIISAFEFIAVNFTYSRPGIYPVNVTMVNPVDSFMSIYKVVAQYPVRNLESNITTPLQIEPDTVTPCVLDLLFTGGVEPATDAAYAINYTDGYTHTGPLNFEIVAPEVFKFEHELELSGTYSVALNVSNLVNFLYFWFVVEVDEPVYGLELIPYPVYVSINTSSLLTTRFSWGTRVNCTLDIGHSIVVIEFICEKDHFNTVTLNFDTVGVYSAVVSTENTIGSVYSHSELGPIIVQRPVEGFSLSCPVNTNYIGPPYQTEYSTIVYFHLILNKDQDLPTNASYAIDYGDGTITAPQLLPTNFTESNYSVNQSILLTFEHTYTYGSNFTVGIDIWNLVSSKTYEVKHDIYEGLINLEIKAFDYDPSTGIKKVGGGPDGNYFTLENLVLIEANWYRGSHITYNWNFGDGTSTESVYYAFINMKKYSDVGTFQISVNATNKINWDYIEMVIHIQKKCSHIGISVDDPRPKNTTFEYQFSPGNIGTAACYRVDFVDGLSESGQFLLFGHADQCQSSWPKLYRAVQEIPGRWFEYRSEMVEAARNAGQSTNITVVNVFQEPGAYNVTLECVNHVSRDDSFWFTGVTKGPCWWPYVNLTTPNQCIEPLCDRGNNGIRIHYMAEKLVVKSDVRINCTSTKIAYYSWQVFLVDEDDGSERAITDLGDADTYSIGARNLIIEQGTLGYGYYHFRLNVSMNEIMGMYGVDWCYIRIVPSPIQAEIIGGDITTHQFGFDLVVDGLTGTIDPDIAPADKSGMKFIWLCRRLCETYPVYDANYTSIISPMVTTCEYHKKWTHDRGCTKGDDLDSSGVVQNATSGVFVVDTRPMYEMEYIEVMVVVRKGGRESIATQTIFITKGSPPIVSLRCVTNCGKKMNPDGRFSLTADISGWIRGMEYMYEWKLFTVPADSLASLSDVYKEKVPEEPQTTWVKHTRTGAAGPGMSVDAHYFPESTDNTFWFFVRSWRWGNDKYDDGGVALKEFKINDRPHPGECHVIKTTSLPHDNTGIAYEDRFAVICENFTDADFPFNFKLGYRITTTEAITWFCENRSWGNQDNPVPFPSGLEERDFQLDVIGRAFDKYGAFADVWTTVKVYPPEQLHIFEMLQNATSLIENLFVGADVKVAPITKCIAGFLNDESDTTSDISETTTPAFYEFMTESRAVHGTRQRWTSAKQEEKERRTNTREMIFQGFKRIQPINLREMQGSSAALSSLSEKACEVSENAQDSAAHIVESYTHILKNEVSASADETEEAASNIINIIGNVMQAAGCSAFEADRESRLLMESEAVTDSPYAAMGPREIESKMSKMKEKKEKAKTTFTKLERTLNRIIQTVSDYKVVGEKTSVIETPKMRVFLSKPLTKDINKDLKIETGGQNFFLPPKSQVLFGDGGNETTFYVDIEVVQMTSNPFTWSNESHASTEVPSDIISLKYRNDTGGDISIKNAPQDFDVFIDRSNYNTTLELSRNVTRDWNEPMVLHEIVVPANSSLYVSVSHFTNFSEIEVPENHTSVIYNASYFETEPVNLSVYFRVGVSPSTELYDMKCELPLTDEDVENKMAYMDEMVFANDTSQSRSTYISANVDRNVCVWSNEEMNVTESAIVYIGVKHSLANDTRNGSVASDTESSSGLEATFLPAVYEMTLFTTKCVWWNNADSYWSTEGCRGGSLSRPDRVHCLCNHLTSFGAGFSVPINTINLNNSAFTKLDENPVVFSTMICVLCGYLLMLIWARKKDKQDVIQAGLTPLPDNDPRDKYLYEVAIFTGSRKNSGTTARVSFMLTGEQEESSPRLLEDGKKKILKRGMIDVFVMAVPKYLGNLTHIRIWHDNMGDNPSWYLSRIQIRDLQTENKSYFVCEQWLSLDDDDGMIDRVVPIASREELVSFNFLFWMQAKTNLTDSHIWFSVFNRPARSNFTRVQRLTCCLSLLYCSMLASIAWYKTEEGTSAQVFKLGSFMFSWTSLYVGVMSSLMAFPVNILIACIFRYACPKSPSTRNKPPHQGNKKENTKPVIIKGEEDKIMERNWVIEKRNSTLEREQQEVAEKNIAFLSPGNLASRGSRSNSCVFRDSESSKFDFGEDNSLCSEDENDTGYHTCPFPHPDQRGTTIPHPDQHSITTSQYNSNNNQEGISVNLGSSILNSLLESRHKSVLTVADLEATLEIEEDSQPHPQPRPQPKVSKKKNFSLPHCFVHVGYFLCLVILGVSFWATVEFGGVFGKKKSQKWLLSFAFSCVESIFISQPLKVLLLAIFYALVIRKHEDSDSEALSTHLQSNEEFVHCHMTETDLQDPTNLRNLENRKSAAVAPPQQDFIGIAKEARSKEIQMFAVVKEIVVSLVFLSLCLLVGYGHRDSWSFSLHQTYNNIFVNTQGVQPQGWLCFKLVPLQITSAEELWKWSRAVLVPGLYDRTVYNGEHIPDVIQDRQSALIGTTRLRQVRVRKDLCPDPISSVSVYCEPSYFLLDEDTESYHAGWKPTLNQSETLEESDEYFRYYNWAELDSYPYQGRFATYGGGGYVADLGKSLSEAFTDIENLVTSGWLDENTRAVFVEFVLYNPNVNLWGVSQLVVEFLQTGAAQPYPKLYIFRLGRYGGAFSYVVMASELVTIAFLIYFTVVETRKITKSGKQYFKTFWNSYEFVILLLGYSVVIVAIYMIVVNELIMDKVHANPRTFTSFHNVVLWDEVSGYLIAFLVFLQTIRFLKLLRFNKKISLLTSTLWFTAGPLLSFGIVFMIGFLAFSMTCHLFFGSIMREFRDFISTMETLLSMMLNKFDYQSALISTRISGPLLFGLFCLSFNFILINVFVTILIEGFNVVRHDLTKQSNDYEIVDFMVERFRAYLKIGESGSSPGETAMLPRQREYLYMDGKTDDEEVLEEFSNKMDDIIDKFYNLAGIQEEDFQNELEDKISSKKQKHILIG
ncbi:hypothetical protein ScPMuIL_003597 [Solemya velum]